MSFVPDKWAKFIVFHLPLENKIYTLLEKSVLVKHIKSNFWSKILIIVHMVRQHLEYVFHFWQKEITFRLQGKLRSIVWTISGKYDNFFLKNDKKGIL